MLYKAKENADLGVKGCGVVGNGEIYGYELTETFFVDNSGFGSDSEMALTFESFLKSFEYSGNSCISLKNFGVVTVLPR